MRTVSMVAMLLLVAYHVNKFVHYLDVEDLVGVIVSLIAAICFAMLFVWAVRSPEEPKKPAEPTP